MKMVGFWVLLLLAEAAHMFLRLGGSSAQDMSSLIVAAIASMEDLTERSNTQKIKNGKINLEDYSQTDLGPSSSAAFTSGPIEHGTSLMLYIPKLTPSLSSQAL